MIGILNCALWFKFTKRRSRRCRNGCRSAMDVPYASAKAVVIIYPSIAVILLFALGHVPLLIIVLIYGTTFGSIFFVPIFPPFFYGLI